MVTRATLVSLAAPSFVRGLARCSRRRGGRRLRRRRWRCRSAPVIPGAAGRRPGVAGLRARRAARRAERDRDAGPRAASPGRRRSTWRRSTRAGGALLIHYGSPVVTSHNTVVCRSRPAPAAAFASRRDRARNGGADLVDADRLHAAAAQLGAELQPRARRRRTGSMRPAPAASCWCKDDADARRGALARVVFYGAAAYTANPAAFDASVFINTPLTVDAQGNVFFGFIVTGGEPGGARQRHRPHRRRRRRQLGRPPRPRPATPPIAKVGDEQRAGAVDRRAGRCTSRSTARRRRHGAGRLPARARQHDARASRARSLLLDPRPARSRASATTRPRRRRSAPTATSSSACSRRHFGAHNARGWLLHFDATLATAARAGRLRLGQHAVDRAGGDGAVVRRHLALPADDQVQQLRRHRQRRRPEPARRSSTRARRQIDPISGPAGDEGGADDRSARRSSRAARPRSRSGASTPPPSIRATKSILVNSEDGYLYRWDLVDQHADAADPADERHRRVVHADGDRRRRRGLRDQQRGAVLDREVARADRPQGSR